MRSLRPWSLLLAVSAALAVAAPAQALPSPPVQAGSGAAFDPPAVLEDVLQFQFAAGTGAELRMGRWRSRTGVDLTPVTRWLDGVEVAPWITVVDWDQLDRWHRRACSVLPTHNRPGHLGLWYRVRARDAAAADVLLQHLSAEPLVAHVYKEPIAYPASAAAAVAPLLSGNDIPPTTPSFTAMQHAHEPTPVGHGVRAVDGVLGARGQGVTFFMIEDTWLVGHEDVSQLVVANFLGPAATATVGEALHGLSGAAIVCADRNAYGITGVSDRVSARFVSQLTAGGLGNAYAQVLQNSQPGDVVLMVMMVIVPGLGPGTFIPIEFYQSVFDVVLTTTASGVHVCAPAGNGDRNLDDPLLLGRFDRNFRDSGACIVAATDAGLLVRASYSNWGSRVDANGWGNNVVSCGYGSLFYPNSDPLQAYTASATGTSSATPHIAGLMAAIQGAARRQLGVTLSNAAVLDLLHQHGALTPDDIGRRPDLVAIFDALGVHDGLSAVEPDVPLGDTIAMTLDGAAGGIAALFGAFGEADVPVGLNRNLHLDPLGAVVLGAYLLGTPGPHYSLTVPNDASLHGAEIFFQAVRLYGSNPLQLSNSCQVTIL
ncbi:MAG: hypothetical protein H6835_12390 [Planctomycetes bacterium]|nr:hypothetical protein [Planctomycetota bacterium]